MPYNEVRDALKRILLQMQNKERMLQRPAEKTFAKNRAKLFESALHFLELRDAKREV